MLTTEKSPQRAPNLAHVVLAAHLRPRDVVAPSAPARAVPYSRQLERRTPRSRHRRRLGGQPEVRENGHDHLALRDVSDDRSATTPRARQNVDPAIADGNCSMILDQVEAGVAVRMAILWRLAAESHESPPA